MVNAQFKDWSNEDLIRSIRNRFRAGGGAADSDGDDGTTDYADFEDVETEEVFKSQLSDNVEENVQHDPEAEERRLKKLALRERFDAQYPVSSYFLICIAILFRFISSSKAYCRNYLSIVSPVHNFF